MTIQLKALLNVDYVQGALLSAPPHPGTVHRTPVVGAPSVRRSTDTPLALPSVGRLSVLLGRCLLVRCPNCGSGPVLTRSLIRIRERCPSCNLRYMRSDDNYFDGAMFCSIMIMEALFGVGLAASIILLWPNVPWDAITYIATGGMIVLGLAMQPLGKVAWLFLDVMFWPIVAGECG